MTGETEHKLRGDYSRMRPDYSVDQEWERLTPSQHDLWRRLYARQIKLIPNYACDEFCESLEGLNFSGGIPKFSEINRKLGPATQWQLVAVPGLVPDLVFFEHLANRRFPVTNWLRTKEELDYIVEPDMFHDFFGHVPILTQPVFADFMQMYGEKAESVIALGGDEMITRLYWYTAEYGLMQEKGQPLKAFGAGLMSSFTELQFAVEGKDAHHVPFDLETVMRTGYEIDKFQRAYFVLPSFDVLRDAFGTADMAGIVGRRKGQPALDPATV